MAQHPPPQKKNEDSTKIVLTHKLKFTKEQNATKHSIYSSM